MNKYAWSFTTLPNEAGMRYDVAGPQDAPQSLVDAAHGELGQRFRMLDADGIVYGYGHIVGDFTGFEPLDDYGMPALGATEVQWLHRGRWITL